MESVPGKIRVQLADRTAAPPTSNSGFFSRLGLGAKKETRNMVELEMLMEKREMTNATKLQITAVYKPTNGGRSIAMSPAFRQQCDELHRELSRLPDGPRIDGNRHDRYHAVMSPLNKLRAGMVGLGMIFDETYRPLFEHAHAEGLYRRRLRARRGRTRRRRLAGPGLGAKSTATIGRRVADFAKLRGHRRRPAIARNTPVDAVCVATPDDRHFEPPGSPLRPASTS